MPAPHCQYAKLPVTHGPPWVLLFLPEQPVFKRRIASSNKRLLRSAQACACQQEMFHIQLSLFSHGQLPLPQGGMHIGGWHAQSRRPLADTFMGLCQGMFHYSVNNCLWPAARFEGGPRTVLKSCNPICLIAQSQL